MVSIISVGLGGFAGAVCRYLIGLLPLGETTGFPIKTFGINVIGCIVIGILTVLAAKNDSMHPQLLLFLKVGLCGGFTTFSTFALETSALIRSGNEMLALLYAFGSVFVGVGVILAMEYFTMQP